MAWPEYAAAYAAVHRVGAAALHLSPDLGADEVRRRLLEVRPAGLLHGPGADPGPLRDTVSFVVRARDCAVSGRGAVDVDYPPETLSDVFYTSGTTGPAKAMLVSHANLGFGRGLNKVAAESFDQEAPVVAPMPLGTAPSAGMTAIFALTTTSTIVVCDPDDPRVVAGTVAGTRAASLMVTPRLLMGMVDGRDWEGHDLGSLTSIGVASAQLPSRYGRAVAQHLPHAGVMVTYGGGSEAIPANIRGRYDSRQPWCVGRPSPGTRLRLLPFDGDRSLAATLPEVPAGEPGRVVLTHEAPQRRFLDPAHDSGVYVGGWIVTNDLAALEPDGTVRIVDRGEDAIRTADGLVSSLALENGLYEHPDVRDAAVVSTGPGGAVVGYVVLAQRSAASGGDVLAAAAAAGAERPDRVEVLPALPRSAQGGKVLKRLLPPRNAADRTGRTSPDAHH